MEEKSWDDIIGEIFKFGFIIGLITLGIWLFSQYFIQTRYTDIRNELDDLNHNLGANSDSFDDAVALLDYNNAFQAYSDYKNLCNKLRIKLNAAPAESISKSKFTTLSQNAITCQENSVIMSKSLTNLRIINSII